MIDKNRIIRLEKIVLSLCEIEMSAEYEPLNTKFFFIYEDIKNYVSEENLKNEL